MTSKTQAYDFLFFVGGGGVAVGVNSLRILYNEVKPVYNKFTTLFRQQNSELEEHLNFGLSLTLILLKNPFYKRTTVEKMLLKVQAALRH